MILEEAKLFIASSKWIFAKTMPQNPHWYILRSKCDDAEFVAFVLYIRANGCDVSFKGRPYKCLDVDGWRYWTMGNHISETILINRAKVHNPDAS
ncbi:hypothetical protein M0R72_13195 [Candidatus Pacearchaeota archaeon]|jgi:hypothetical protein|nr:hypothetical protein [Candidatus Pacearchaeota archaeon]